MLNFLRGRFINYSVFLTLLAWFFLSILFHCGRSFSGSQKYYTGNNRLNMGLNRINMRLFTLSLMELLIGIAAQGRRALWGCHQSHMTRTAVICVCGKTPLPLLPTDFSAGAQLWGWEEMLKGGWTGFPLVLEFFLNRFCFMIWFLSDAMVWFSTQIRSRRMDLGLDGPFWE